MRIFSYMLIAVSSLAAFCACGDAGPADPDTPAGVQVGLTADKTSIYADGADAVTFTVTADGADVTSKAVISVGGLAMTGNVYKASVPGTYSFSAVYEGVTSNTVNIDVLKKETVESQFMRHVAVWEFTGAWCTNCPAGYSNINFVVSRNDAYNETVHMMAFHSNYSGDDDLALPDHVTDEIMAKENIDAYGFPSFLTDLRTGGGLVTATEFKNSLVESFEEYPAHCGVAVSSEVNGSKINATVKLYPELSSSYRIAVFVVEDRVKYYQKDGTLTHDEYNHRHVVRRIVTPTYLGDRLGNLNAGAETSKSYEIEVDSAWNLDETYIYALALDANSNVNNMNVCKVGEDSDYNRIK